MDLAQRKKNRFLFLEKMYKEVQSNYARLQNQVEDAKAKLKNIVKLCYKNTEND